MSVVVCSAEAAAAGVRPGMPLGEARALLEFHGRREGSAPSALQRAIIRRHDPAGDRAALEALADRCTRYSPCVGLEDAERPECLLLDITGCAPLFGSEQRLADLIARDFAAQGFTTRIAIADTIGAAWALVVYGESQGPEKSGEWRVESGGPERTSDAAVSEASGGCQAPENCPPSDPPPSTSLIACIEAQPSRLIDPIYHRENAGHKRRWRAGGGRRAREDIRADTVRSLRSSNQEPESVRSSESETAASPRRTPSPAPLPVGEGGKDSVAATRSQCVEENSRGPDSPRSPQTPGTHALHSSSGPQPSALSPPPNIAPPRRHRALLRSLPIAALRLAPATVAMLHEFDICSIGQLQALPRASLPARFGVEVLRRLDQACGDVSEQIAPRHIPEPTLVRWEFDEPLEDRQAIDTVLRLLIERLVAQLLETREGVLQLACRFDLDGGDAAQFSFGLVRATASARHLLELARMQLEKQSFAAGVVQVRLKAAATGPLEVHQRALFETDPRRDGQKQLDVLVERLSARLGRRAITRSQLFPDFQPEHAVRYEPWIEAPAAKTKAANAAGKRSSSRKKKRPATRPAAAALEFAFSRPLRLKAEPVEIEVIAVYPEGPPRQFVWEGREHVIARHWGPERIEAGWWRDRHVRRDYYRVETTTGQRYWLFRPTGGGGWFLHGVFE